MKVAVLSWGKESRKLYELLDRCPEYFVVCAVEENSSKWGADQAGIPVVSSGKAACLFEDGEIDCFIMPSMEESYNLHLAKMLRTYHINVNKLLYAPVETLRNDLLSDEEKLSHICLFEDRTELETMEVHASDHCNLNCKNCSMFCGLVDKPVFPDYDEFEKGIDRLKTYFSHIKKFRVIGGEPLLNPELGRFLIKIRQTYPYTDIRLISNGILVMQMSEELIHTIKENDVTFIVTQYTALKASIDRIKAFLDDRGIKNIVTEAVLEFQKIYNAKGDSPIEENFYRCHWKGSCATMYGTRIATCFPPFVLHYLSDAFSLNIPISGIIDLSGDGLSAKEIRKRMHTPFDLCRYCAPKGSWSDWEVMTKGSRNLSEWSI